MFSHRIFILQGTSKKEKGNDFVTFFSNHAALIISHVNILNNDSVSDVRSLQLFKFPSSLLSWHQIIKHMSIITAIIWTSIKFYVNYCKADLSLYSIKQQIMSLSLKKEKEMKTLLRKNSHTQKQYFMDAVLISNSRKYPVGSFTIYWLLIQKWF